MGRYNTRNSYRMPWLLNGISIDNRHRLLMRMAFPQAVASIEVQGSIENGELHLAPVAGQDLRSVPITEAGMSLSLDGTRDGLAGMLISAAGPMRCWLPYDRESASLTAVTWAGTWSGTITGAKGEVAAHLDLTLDDCLQGRGVLTQGTTVAPLTAMLDTDSLWCRLADQTDAKPFQLRCERTTVGSGLMLTGNGPFGRMALMHARTNTVGTGAGPNDAAVQGEARP